MHRQPVEHDLLYGFGTHVGDAGGSDDGAPTLIPHNSV